MHLYAYRAGKVELITYRAAWWHKPRTSHLWLDQSLHMVLPGLNTAFMSTNWDNPTCFYRIIFASHLNCGKALTSEMVEMFLPSPGGRQGKMPVTALEAFDLEMKSWTRYPCIPSRRAFSCCAANDRSLFSLGGLQQPGPHNFYSRPHFVSTMEEYDLDQGKSCLL